jgi:hypothetical protein
MNDNAPPLLRGLLLLLIVSPDFVPHAIVSTPDFDFASLGKGQKPNQQLLISSNEATAHRKPKNTNHNHHNIEIATCGALGHGAKGKAHDRNRHDEPVGPTKERDERRNRENERDQADED